LFLHDPFTHLIGKPEGGAILGAGAVPVVEPGDVELMRSTGLLSHSSPKISGNRIAAYAQARTDILQSGSGNIVELVISFLLRFSWPEIEVWFVPNFEIPICNLFDTVSLLPDVGQNSK
jgi:hypothetical protein